MDRFRRDGRTDGYVSSTRTVKSVILRTYGGWLDLRGFPEKVWYLPYGELQHNRKTMWFVLAKDKYNWRIIDYLEKEIDKPPTQLKKSDWGALCV